MLDAAEETPIFIMPSYYHKLKRSRADGDYL